jgi:hypothetical protein
MRALASALALVFVCHAGTAWTADDVVSKKSVLKKAVPVAIARLTAATSALSWRRMMEPSSASSFVR